MSALAEKAPVTFSESTAKAEHHPRSAEFAPAGTLALSVIANVTHFHFLTVTGLSLPNNNPFNVIATVRAPNNDNPGFSDSFCLTVNKINRDSIVFKIWRTDSSANPSAAIRIDFFVVV